MASDAGTWESSIEWGTMTLHRGSSRQPLLNKLLMDILSNRVADQKSDTGDKYCVHCRYENGVVQELTQQAFAHTVLKR